MVTPEEENKRAERGWMTIFSNTVTCLSSSSSSFCLTFIRRYSPSFQNNARSQVSHQVLVCIGLIGLPSWLLWPWVSVVSSSSTFSPMQRFSLLNGSRTRLGWRPWRPVFISLSFYTHFNSWQLGTWWRMWPSVLLRSHKSWSGLFVSNSLELDPCSSCCPLFITVPMWVRSWKRRRSKRIEHTPG